MAEVPFDEGFEDYWGVPDFDGPAHARPLPRWLSGTTALPACRHWRQTVDLLDGVVVFASAWFDRPMRGRGHELDWPDLGFYLDGSWASAALMCSPGFRPPFAPRAKAQVLVYPWPDLGVPRDPRRFARALRWVLAQASEGRRVEIGCAGGHGRTGTALACLLVLQGASPRSGIRRIRRTYCSEAIESADQEAVVRGLAR